MQKISNQNKFLTRFSKVYYNMIRPRIDPSEYARQKKEKAEAAKKRREEIKRKSRGEDYEEPPSDSNNQSSSSQSEAKQQHSGSGGFDEDAPLNSQYSQQPSQQQSQQKAQSSQIQQFQPFTSFTNPPQNPQGYEFSPAFFEKNRVQSGDTSDSDRPTSCLALSPNQQEGCVGSSDHALYTFQLSSGTGLRRLYSRHGGHSDWVSTVTYLEDGRVLSGGMDGKLCLWRRGGGAQASAEDLIGEQGSISKVSVVPAKSNIAASSGYDGSICVWDLSKVSVRADPCGSREGENNTS